MYHNYMGKNTILPHIIKLLSRTNRPNTRDLSDHQLSTSPATLPPPEPPRLPHHQHDHPTRVPLQTQRERETPFKSRTTDILPTSDLSILKRPLSFISRAPNLFFGRPNRLETETAAKVRSISAEVSIFVWTRLGG